MSNVKPITFFFRTAVRRIIRSQGRTIADVAEAAGMSQPGLSRLLLGEGDVGMNTAGRVAKALNVPVVELLTTKGRTSGKDERTGTRPRGQS